MKGEVRCSPNQQHKDCAPRIKIKSQSATLCHAFMVSCRGCLKGGSIGASAPKACRNLRSRPRCAVSQRTLCDTLEAQANIQALLLLRRNLPLRRDCLLLLLFWLQLRRMGAAVRYVMPERGSQFFTVVGEDLRVVCAA